MALGRLGRFGILFYTLLASLVLAPLVDPLGLGAGVVEALLAVSLCAAVLAVDRGPIRSAAIVILAIALAARPGAALLGQNIVSLASLATWGVLALIAAANTLVFALRGRTVGAEHIYAALATYLLAGLFFGLIYWVIEQAAPGSLAVGGVTAHADLRLATTVYYSFVTLASLGYGDVLPLSDPARGLAVVEAVGGQLYLAVLVARLVGASR